MQFEMIDILLYSGQFLNSDFCYFILITTILTMKRDGKTEEINHVEFPSRCAVNNIDTLCKFNILFRF